MEKWIIVVESSCNDPSREDEFNDWYENIHIPDIMETECYVRATRYELAEPAEGKGKYLAVYEIETEDFEADKVKHWNNMKAKKAQGRWTDLISVVSRGEYRQKSVFTR